MKLDDGVKSEEWYSGRDTGDQLPMGVTAQSGDRDRYASLPLSIVSSDINKLDAKLGSMSSKKQTIEQLAATVSDSTDFPDIATAPGLRTLDSTLRCPICCELFSGPVTLRCGHCFCSLVCLNL